MAKPQKTIIINNEIFHIIKTRIYTPISVYKGTNSFLRIGPPDLIKQENGDMPYL